MKTPEEYLNEIDKYYSWAKRDRVSRFDVTWGKWSVIMNRAIRLRIRDERDPDNLKLKYVFIYWTIMSQLLELHFRFRILRNKQKRKLFKEASDIKEIILTGNGLQPLSEDDLEEQLLKGIMK